MEITEIGGKRELDGLVGPEELVEHLGDRRASLAQQRPQAAHRLGGVPQPKSGIVLVLGGERDRVAGGGQTAKVFRQGFAPVRKARGGCLQGSIHPARQDEWLTDPGATHLVKVSDVDEFQLFVQAERAKNRQLRIVGVEPVDLVKRALDRERTVPIDGGGTAADVVALEHQHAPSAARVERRCGQPAET